MLILGAAFTLYSQHGNLQVDLTVNGYHEIAIQPGYPVIMGLSVLKVADFNQESISDLLPDTVRLDPGVRRILDSLLTIQSERDTTSNWHERIVFVLKPEGQAKNFKIKKKELLTPYAGQQQVFYSDKANVADFGVDPGETSYWKAGTIAIRAGYISQTRPDTVWSEEALIRIIKPALKKTGEYSDAQLHFVASYWIRRGDCQLASLYAEELYNRNPVPYTHSVLLAEVLLCKNEFEKALDYYRKALIKFENQADPDMFPPEFLHRRIEDLQEKFREETEK